MGNAWEDWQDWEDSSDSYKIVVINYDELIVETKKESKNQGAILFRIEGEEIWIPKSEKVMADLWKEDKQVEVYHWFAEKIGVI